jgi:hypothetical protein
VIRIDYSKSLPVYYVPPKTLKVEAKIDKHKQDTATFKATLEAHSQSKHNQKG